ncbi:MAG: hypothetical protein F6K48_04580 [Okeania sp. SIO3H1]|nr:hypothetical protein [Okeania sp. SIO3H1]
MTDKFNSFVALAKQRYRITLTSVEQKLLKAIVKGEVADYQVKSPELTLLKEQLDLELLKAQLKGLEDVDKLEDLEGLGLEQLKELEKSEHPEQLKQLLAAIAKEKEFNNPATAESWGEKRILSAKFIEWLCTDVEAFKYFTNHGLQICGAKISGKLNLEFVKFESLLYFTECVFVEKIILKGAKVEEVKFDGSHVVGIDAGLIKVRGSLHLENGFQSKGEIRLSEATISGQLLCSEGHFFNKEGTALSAENIKVKADVFLRNGFKAEGEVRLSGATIGGQLNCIKGLFSNEKGDALFADNIEVKADVFLSNDFKAEGKVSLLEATIGGQLNCIKGLFSNKRGDALFADNIEVKADVFLSNDFKAEGKVSLSGAIIGGTLDCHQGHFCNEKEDALSAENIEVKASVLLSYGFIAKGKVILSGATIGGQLYCSQGRFYNKEGAEEIALSADNIEVNADVFMRNGFRADGEVSLSGATIGGQLSCSAGHFSNPGKYALFAQNIEVKTNIILGYGFKAEGEVDLTAANIKGNLNCTHGNFSNEKGNVLSAEGINVDGDIILDRGTFEGKIYLVSARVDDTLSMVKIQEKVNFPLLLFILYFFIKSINNYRIALLLQKKYQRIESEYKRRESASHYMKLDLQFARIGRLRDDEQSWPQKKNLNLDGFIYQKFGADDANDNIKVPKDSKTRLKWLRLKPENEFFPQTYEQLAEVLKKEGDTDAATEILIHKERDIRPKLNWLSQFWNYFLDITIVYGYKPTRALFLSSIFIFSGVYLFRAGYENCSDLISNNKCLFSPSSEISPYIENQETEDKKTNNNKTIDIDYPEFNFWLYSLDTFIPIVDLHQQTYWLPNPKKGQEIPLILFKVKAGRLLRWYLWVHIIFGWILTSLWVAGFSGLVRG